MSEATGGVGGTCRTGTTTVSRRGISVLDLVLGLPGGGGSMLLPDDVRHTLESLAVLELTTTTTPVAYVHQGVSQAIGDAPLALPKVHTWAVESPVLTTGLPFRVVRTRAPAGTGTRIEASSTPSTVDLYLDPIGITLPRVTPAVVVGGTFGSANPAHLVPDPDRDGVRVWGRAILRITLGSPVTVSIVDWPDPFSAVVGAGAVELTVDPPSFLFDRSGFGTTVDRVVIDVSSTSTPADVVARGHDATWQGISLREGALYLPRNAPVVGDLSIALRDLLVGIPPSRHGLQGEAAIEFGRTPVNPTVAAFRESDGQVLAGEVNAAGYTLVYLRTAVAEVSAATSTESTANWVLPDGTRRDDSRTTGWFTARAGESMRATFLEQVGDEKIPGEEEAYVFTLAADDGSAFIPAAPTITLTAGATAVERVASVSGSAAALSGIVFTAVVDDGDADDAFWQLGIGAMARSGTGPTFEPDVAQLALGRHDLLLRHGDTVRRCEVQLLDAGELIAGATGGPRDAVGTARAVSQILATFDLAAFDRDGRRVTNGLDAVFGDGDTVEVPAGGLAHVTIGTERLVPPELRHVEVLMLFNQATAAPDLFQRPDGTFVDAPTHVREWAASFSGDVTFLVIGRCCDLGGNDYNKELATQRARLAAAWIEGTVAIRSEQDPPTGNAVKIQNDAVDDELLSADTEAAPLRLITALHGTIAGTDSTTPPRPQFRRVDIYAVRGEATAATPIAHGELMPRPEQREALLPGDDAPAPLPPSRRNPKLPFRTRLTLGWDSPSVHEPADAVPTLAELLLEWQASALAVPDLDEPVAPVPNDPDVEVFTLIGRWTHDPQSGQTLFTLSWDSSGDADGLAHVDGRVLAFVLAVGPALLGGIDPDEGGDELGVSLFALLVAGFIAEVFVSSGRVVLNGITYQVLPLEGGPVQRLVVDYSVEIGFKTDRLAQVGIVVETDPDHPMRVRYRNVGVEFDLSGPGKQWYETLRLVYGDVSLEVEDPGAWTIEGDLGRLLRVVATRVGSGSMWVEVDLEFLLDLGVVTISKSTVRVTVDDDGTPHVELRGITVTVDVPNTITGSGTLAVGAHGAFRAGIDVTVIPAGLTIGAALALDDTGFFVLEIKAILPVGIPLGPTGLGLYGFVGRFVTNGSRAIGAEPRDLVARELDWYRTPAVDKYRSEPGQWALGLGAVVGTAPDTGFAFNALGMFVISFPDPSVIFSIEAHFLASPGAASDSPADAEAAITGLAVVDPDTVVIAVDGRYELTDVIDLRVPVSAFFGPPLDSFVRIGADGFAGRAGDPVTATLLPTTLNAKVWAYLMVEGGRLFNLGGDPRFTFEGFCVGFGAGWSVEWEAGPVSLRASAKVLVGLGTKPFMLVGGVFVEGELSLAFLSIGASGELVVTIQDSAVSLTGKLCATFDLGFFEKKGCVEFAIGSGVGVTAPKPAPPLLAVSFCDRTGLVVQQADASDRTADAPVWPDTVPVLEFAHPLACALPADSAFDPGPPPPGPEWSGTSKLKYAYRLTRVQLETDDGAVGPPLDAAWWWPTSRPGVVAEGDLALSAEEGRWLALLTWDPRSWSRLLGDEVEATGTPGEPATTVSRLCDPVLVPPRACAFGVDAVRVDAARVEIRHDTFASTLSSRFAWRVREHVGPIDLADGVALATRRGWTLRPGRTVPLPELAAVAQLPDDAAGVYEPATFADRLGPVLTTQLSGAFEPALVDPALTLLVLPWERDPVAGVAFCVDFANPESVVFTDDGFDFRGLHFVDLSGSGLTLVETTPPANVRELRIPRLGVRVEFPLPVRGVRVDVRSQGLTAIVATATDGSGAVVDTALCPAETRRMLTLRSDSLIQAVTLAGGDGEGVLISVCFVDPLLPDPDDTPDGSPFPVVVGTRLDGPTVVWVPTLLTTVDIAGLACPVVRYDPPNAGPTWLAADVLPWPGGRVGVVEVCGTSTVARQLADDQTAYVADLVQQWNDLAAEDAPERRSLLAPDTEYTVRVSWEYQSWIATDEQPAPPPTAAGVWIPADDDILCTFRTAAATSEFSAPVNVRDESVFDPRAVGRYLLATEPGGGDTATHFRDDPILVHFSVDHVEQLLGLYGRTLAFSIQRTDPPRGAAARYRPVPMEPSYVALAPARMNAADARLVAAAAALPCVDLPALGGTTAVLGDEVELEPRARYDLRLAATAPEAAEALIALTNFTASRYASPTDLLAALGCTEPLSPVLPNDAVVGAEPPRGGAAFEAGDAALDATLAVLGLDPWPLAVRPRVVALWRLAGPTAWRFEGVLIEADEAVVRPGRLAVDAITVGPAAEVALDVVRISSSGARLLATAPEPLTLTAEDVLTVALASTATGTDGTASTVTVRGSRRILDRPRLAYQELP